MSNDPNWVEEAVGLLDIADEAGRRERIGRMSDPELTRCYAMLSDPRYARNVPFLSLLEEELSARGLPLGRIH